MRTQRFGIEIEMCSLDAIDVTVFGLARGCYLKKFIYEKKPAGNPLGLLLALIIRDSCRQ